MKVIIREFQILQALPGHEYVLHFSTQCEDNSFFYMVMELCEGVLLVDRILPKADKRYCELDPAVIIWKMFQVSAQCHLTGLLYHAIKQENFLLQSTTTDSPLKASDFSLSNFNHSGSLFKDFVGNVHYVAHEALWLKSGPKSNVWSIELMDQFEVIILSIEIYFFHLAEQYIETDIWPTGVGTIMEIALDQLLIERIDSPTCIGIFLCPHEVLWYARRDVHFNPGQYSIDGKEDMNFHRRFVVDLVGCLIWLKSCVGSESKWQCTNFIEIVFREIPHLTNEHILLMKSLEIHGSEETHGFDLNTQFELSGKLDMGVSVIRLIFELVYIAHFHNLGGITTSGFIQRILCSYMVVVPYFNCIPYSMNNWDKYILELETQLADLCCEKLDQSALGDLSFWHSLDDIVCAIIKEKLEPKLEALIQLECEDFSLIHIWLNPEIRKHCDLYDHAMRFVAHPYCLRQHHGIILKNEMFGWAVNMLEQTWVVFIHLSVHGVLVGFGSTNFLCIGAGTDYEGVCQF